MGLAHIYLVRLILEEQHVTSTILMEVKVLCLGKLQQLGHQHRQLGLVH